MPKEFTHLLISHAAISKIAPENVGIGRCLKENYRFFMLGAILCDSPYYHLPFSGGRGRLIALSKNIHNPFGEIDVDFFRCLSEMAAKEKKGSYLAFICGILSHHLADRNFHPFIFYFTGKYSDPSRHRFMEGLIDLRLMDVMAGRKICRTTIADYLVLEKAAMLPCLRMFILAAMPRAGENETAGMAELLWKALRFEIFLSRRYSNRLLKKAMIRTNIFLKGRLSPFVTLFYPEEDSCDLPLLNSTFRYCDPFSGEERDACLDSVAERTAEQLASAIILAHRNMKDSKPFFDEDTMGRLFKERDKGAFEFRKSDTKALDTAMQSFLAPGD